MCYTVPPMNANSITVITPYYSIPNSWLWKPFLKILLQKTICCLSFGFSFTQWKILVLSISNQFSCYNIKSTCKPIGTKNPDHAGSSGEAVQPCEKIALASPRAHNPEKGRAHETQWCKAVNKNSTRGKRQEYKEFREKKMTSCSCIKIHFIQEGKSEEE